MSSAAANHIDITSEDRLRADLYNYLGLMLSGPPDEFLLAQTAGLSGDDTDLGRAIMRLAECAATTKAKDAEREFNALFIGLGRGELLALCQLLSYRVSERKPLAVLRSDLSARRISRADNVFEPEDNIATLMEVMAGLIVGRFADPATLADQKVFLTDTSPRGPDISIRTSKGQRPVCYIVRSALSGALSWRSSAKRSDFSRSNPAFIGGGSRHATQFGGSGLYNADDRERSFMSDKTQGASRRDFLKLAGTAAPAAAVAVVASGTQAEAAPVDPTSDKMQDTTHTRAYLDSARF